MTVQEFNIEFDLHYDNIASKGAPGLDLYEKSVFLTKAQLQLINDKYNPQGNKYKEGFEGSEKRRVELKNLIKPYKTTVVVTNDDKISENSYTFNIPDDTYLIIQEQCKLDQTVDCFKNKYTGIVPKTYDEYNTQSKNPFKTPYNNIVWRLDISKVNDKKAVELISKYSIDEYNIRYIQYPKPIILTDLIDEYNGLSIDGYTELTECELDESIHREIIDRAVELAVSDYKYNDLQNRVQLNMRNE